MLANDYTFCYSIQGILSFAPTYVTVQAYDREAAKLLALDKVLETNCLAIGREVTIH